nr:hypothetical protein [uncultured Flavobacterium sp.]
MKKKNSINWLTSAFASVLLVAVIFCGCNPQPKNGSTKTRNGDYITKVIDSCEYIEYDYGIFDQRVYSLTHKGNCKFCVERNLNLKIFYYENIRKTKSN